KGYGAGYLRFWEQHPSAALPISALLFSSFGQKSRTSYLPRRNELRQRRTWARSLLWLFWMACLGWARGRRYASRYEPPAVPSISSWPSVTPTRLRATGQH